MHSFLKMLLRKDDVSKENLAEVHRSQNEVAREGNRLLQTLDELIEKNAIVTRRKTRHHVQKRST